MTWTAAHFFSSDRAGFDLAKESEFFGGLKMRNGTFKLTRPSRFADVEPVLAPVLRRRGGKLESVLDLGVSSGVTTVEFVNFLSRENLHPEVVGTDLFIEAHLIELAPGIRVLADSTGLPLQYDIGGLALRAWVRRLDYLTFAVLPHLVARSVLKTRLRVLIDAGSSQKVRLESRSLVGHNIKLIENDIFQYTPDLAEKFDFVRAANILNKNCFPTSRLRVAVRNIRAYCRREALVLVVRTGRDSRNDGTLFQLDRHGAFHVAERIGSGSDIEGLFMSTTESDP